ncbi:membrane-bound alkaline phosphatase-like [Anastrepha obliqua]|uniref:membrane-bound alkaline phosphatase-like n=1 Tax=Anastrepha obliqua TaxID=95512 RepID=UPI00240929CF|nr:membrane-bound alkaline phosphatase-like [Anastrepha obliqua]
MSPQTQKLHKHWFVAALLLLAMLTVYTTEALPTYACGLGVDDDDCIDAAMHPDLRPGSMSNRAQGNSERKIEYWLEQGKEFVSKQANAKRNTGKAKNIILFLGDGMGLTTFTAARQLLGGEEQKLSFEKFPYTGFSKTYSVNTMVPDSACTSTAYLCGVKANHGTIGVNGHVERSDCEGMVNTTNHVHSIAKWALDAGKSAGLVTTTRVTHASPAGVYAHVADREWENDAELAADCGEESLLQDIALQLMKGVVGKQLKVILGGGKREFIDSTLYTKGKRKDGRNLIEEYQQQSARNAYVETLEELQNLDVKSHDRLLGLFHRTHLDYNLEAEETQPSLKEMTVRAIEMLQKDDNGFFLFVEGGRIDTAHHYNMAEYALDETVELSKAIEAAREMTSEDDTLIVVTADHSHTFSISGYQDRGSNIFDVTPNLATDDRSYLALSYANGPGFEDYYNTAKYKRRHPEKVDSDTYPSTVPLESASHGGEDVAVFASGPWAHLFTGVYEQNTIPHLMAYAACVGEGLKAC